MRITEKVLLLSHIYSGEKGDNKPRHSRSRFFQKWSDTQPFGRQVSVSSSSPEPQDLEVAGNLLKPGSVHIPSVSLSRSSSKQSKQPQQTLVSVATGQEFDDCMQVPSDQAGNLRFYSHPKIIATAGDNYSGTRLSVARSDTLLGTSTRSSKRTHKFSSIRRIFEKKCRSRGLRIWSTVSGNRSVTPSAQCSVPPGSVQNLGVHFDVENASTPRKVSDQTIQSEQSTRTVCRHPSKRCNSGVGTLDIDDRPEDSNPFTDRDSSRKFSVNSNPFLRKDKSSDETDIFLSSETEPLCETHVERPPVRQSPKPSSLRPPHRKSSRSWDSLSYRIFSDTSVAMRNFDQSKAAHDFNFFARKLDLPIIKVDMIGRPVTGLSIIPLSLYQQLLTVL